MAKKKVAPIPAHIAEEKGPNGLRLTVHPFENLGSANAPMEISVEIRRPQDGRHYAKFTRFTGVPVQKPLGVTDLVIWMEAMRVIDALAVEKVQELNAK